MLRLRLLIWPQQAFAWNPDTNNLVNFKCTVNKASAGSLQVEFHTYISNMVPPLDQMGELTTLINLALIIIVLIFFAADLRMLGRHIMDVGLEHLWEHPPYVMLFNFSCSSFQVGFTQHVKPSGVVILCSRFLWRKSKEPWIVREFGVHDEWCTNQCDYMLFSHKP